MITKLTSYTIVPDSLYVERRADYQLRSIVESMQRPGYVLVSRQMGKTNLLLRAKRKWENEQDLFVFVDMSNIKGSERACFQSLIDIAIDTHEHILGPVRERIQSLRRYNYSKSPVQAHNEELRVLLGATPRRLVFILDEIDSLTLTPFSDNVFSQIRSIYFSRVNYPVYDKLTYVLSGVVEPTEIIKNPKISPFNIGEKIFLDDFTYNEFMTFINKAELDSWGEDVISRIFYWTNGNPRMTWDLCCGLQNYDYLVPETVDSVVKTMYLTTYDKPPVDSIRGLVKEDLELRIAIFDLVQDKSENLSDNMKSKLYLSGIVNYSNKDVQIKNPIIRESLSLNWLQKIEEEEKGLLAIAVEFYEKGLYRDSVLTFERFLQNNAFPEIDAPMYYYDMGVCYYHLGDYSRSLTLLTKKTIDPNKSKEVYRYENFYAGEDCLKLGKDPEALAYFNTVMQGGLRDSFYYWSKLGTLLIDEKSANNDKEKIQDIMNEYQSLLSLTNQQINSGIKSNAAFRLARLCRSENKPEASQFYDQAILFGSESFKPRLLAEKYDVATSDEERQAILASLVSAIEKVESLSDATEPESDLGLNREALARILYLIFAYAHREWDVVRSKTQLLSNSYGDAMLEVFQQSYNSQSGQFRDKAELIIKELYKNLDNVDYSISPHNRLSVYKYYACLSKSEDSVKEFVLKLRDSDERVDDLGMKVIKDYAWDLRVKKDYKRILDELDWISERYPNRYEGLDTVTLLHFEQALLESYYSFPDKKKLVLDKANLILSLVGDPSTEAKQLKQIKDTALFFKRKIEDSMKSAPQELSR